MCISTGKSVFLNNTPAGYAHGSMVRTAPEGSDKTWPRRLNNAAHASRRNDFILPLTLCWRWHNELQTNVHAVLTFSLLRDAMEEGTHLGTQCQGGESRYPAAGSPVKTALYSDALEGSI